MSELQLVMLEKPRVSTEVKGWLIHPGGKTEAVRGMHLSGVPAFISGRFFIRWPKRIDLLVDGRGHIAYTAPEFIIEDTCGAVNLRCYGIVGTEHQGNRDPMGHIWLIRPAVYDSLDSLLSSLP